MALQNDPWRRVGATVHAKATAATDPSQCARLYGSLANGKMVNDIVKKVLVDRSTGRASTSLRVEWTMSSTPTVTTSFKTLKINNIKPGPAPVPSSSTSVVVDNHDDTVLRRTNDEHTVSSDACRCMNQAGDHCEELLSQQPRIAARKAENVVHDMEWFEEDVQMPIGGYVPRTFWSVITMDGKTIREGGGIGARSPYDCFMTMFPFEHVVLTKELTHERLLKSGKNETSISELLRFFGILMLMTRFELGNKLDLWSTEYSSKYVSAPCFGKTGMGRDRFVDILKCIRFSKQPDEQGELSSVQWRWSLVQDVFDAIKKHRATYVVPSELICVDESISRWYGIGGHWIEVGLLHYVAIDRKLPSKWHYTAYCIAWDKFGCQRRIMPTLAAKPTSTLVRENHNIANYQHV